MCESIYYHSGYENTETAMTGRRSGPAHIKSSKNTLLYIRSFVLTSQHGNVTLSHMGHKIFNEHEPLFMADHLPHHWGMFSVGLLESAGMSKFREVVISNVLHLDSLYEHTVCLVELYTFSKVRKICITYLQEEDNEEKHEAPTIMFIV